MRFGNFDASKEVFIVAEIGNNHEGNFSLAQQLIGLAAEAGAHAVKFQTFKTEQYISKKEEARFKRTKGFELSQEQFAALSDFAKKSGVMFFSTPFDLESVDFLDKLQPIFKISSGDNNFYPLIERVAATGKPIILSSGLADLTQLHHTKSLIEMLWQSRGISQTLALLHCITSYPVKPEEASLRTISKMRQEFGDIVGYSDHTLGIEACVLAVALGARIIEKHFTIDKNYSDFRDHKLAAEPAEFKELVERVKTAAVLLGSEGRAIQEGERAIEVSMRRSIIAKRDLPKGHILKWNDLAWARPAVGLPPGAEAKILGYPLKRSLALGDPILETDLDN